MDPIRQYFHPNYGEVDRIDFDDDSKCRIVTVTFKRVKSANAALAQKKHTIHGKLMNVSIQRETEFLALNNDCIYEIFKYLKLNDLIQITHVCSRLQKLAQMHVSSTFRVVVDDLHAFGSLTHKVVLTNKGSFPTMSPPNEQILAVLLKYCEQTLTHLELHQFVFDYYTHLHSIYEYVRSRFSRLQKLVFTNCFFRKHIFKEELNNTFVDEGCDRFFHKLISLKSVCMNKEMN